MKNRAYINSHESSQVSGAAQFLLNLHSYALVRQISQSKKAISSGLFRRKTFALTNGTDLRPYGSCTRNR